jgi:WD40 repeat protein
MMMLLELPDALRENILRFSSIHAPDHLALACTCRQLLQEVETFSKKELDRIKREHDVDDDWLYRAGMQALATGQQEAGWYIPSSISHRRMLRSAYRTHIYSLGTDPSQEWTGVISLAMHPDGKRMLSGGHGNERDSTVLRLWDIQAKRCIRSFIGHSTYVDSVCFSAGYVTSQAWEEGNLRIWDLSNGTCRHSIEVNLHVGKHAASNEEVFVPNNGDEDDEDGTIDAINIHTGVIRSSPRQAWCTERIELHLCGNFLLAAVPDDDPDTAEEGAHKAGIYVLDRSSLELMNHVAGSYSCIKSAANGDVVAKKAYDGRFEVFHLVDDRLVFRTSFERCCTHTHQNYESILLVHNSKAYIHQAGPASCIEVYNILTGDLERTLWHPPGRVDVGQFPRCLVAGKKELFCGFNTSAGRIRNATSAIKVYLLD